MGEGNYFYCALSRDANRFQINTFHWHVVDSQSFALVVPGFTELSEKAAYSASSVYTAADVKDIVAYAAAVSTYINNVFVMYAPFLTLLPLHRREESMYWRKLTLQDTHLLYQDHTPSI